MQGQIVKQISNTWTVLVDDKVINCQARGKFRKNGLSPLVGDYVIIDNKNNIIEEILPRKNELIRPSVANVDIALIVTSLKKPDISYKLLDRLLVMIMHHNITPVICMTKLDLLTNEELNDIKKIMDYYEKIGIKVMDNRHLSNLRKELKNKLVVLTGQSGAGKSTLLNKLNSNLNIDTSPISEALNRGVHTTRHTEIYEINKIRFVDTPGFSALDLKNVTKESLRNCYPEFKKYTCAFSDCYHISEKNCEVKKALERGKILISRYENYLGFLEECNENSRKLYK